MTESRGDPGKSIKAQHAEAAERSRSEFAITAKAAGHEAQVQAPASVPGVVLVTVWCSCGKYRSGLAPLKTAQRYWRGHAQGAMFGHHGDMRVAS